MQTGCHMYLHINEDFKTGETLELNQLCKEPVKSPEGNFHLIKLLIETFHSMQLKYKGNC